MNNLTWVAPAQTYTQAHMITLHTGITLQEFSHWGQRLYTDGKRRIMRINRKRRQEIPSAGGISYGSRKYMPWAWPPNNPAHMCKTHTHTCVSNWLFIFLIKEATKNKPWSTEQCGTHTRYGDAIAELMAWNRFYVFSFCLTLSLSLSLSKVPHMGGYKMATNNQSKGWQHAQGSFACSAT